MHRRLNNRLQVCRVPSVTSFLRATRPLHATFSKQSRVFISPSKSDSSSLKYLSEGREDSGDSLKWPSYHSSTLTASERSIFEGLFHDIQSEATSQVSRTPFYDRLAEDDTLNFAEDEPLISIFERAIANAKSPDQTQFPSASYVKNGMGEYHPLTNSSVQQTRFNSRGYATRELDKGGMPHPSSLSHTSPELPARPREPQSVSTTKRNAKSTEYSDEATEARRGNFRDVDSLFSSVKCDIDVWQVLEKEVFNQLNAVALRVKSELPTSNADWSRVKSPAKVQSWKKKKSKVIGQDVKSLPAMQPLSVLHTKYASDCVTALRILRTRFPYSSYAITLLPSLKAFGPISYALCASTELYNEIMYIRWVYYKDTLSCAELLEEMLDRGVATDACTHAVFIDAKRQQRKIGRPWVPEMSKDAGYVGMSSSTGGNPKGLPNEMEPRKTDQEGRISYFNTAWWSLEGVKSGWRRWEEVEEQALARFREDLERKSQERISPPDDGSEEDFDIDQFDHNIMRAGART